MNISVFDIIYPAMSKKQERFFLDIFKDINENCFNGILQKPSHLGVFSNLEFDGLTMRYDGISAIILNPLQDADELLYTIAHEVIHLQQIQLRLELNHGSNFKYFQKVIADYLGVKNDKI